METKSNSDKLSRQRATLNVAFMRLATHFNASSSVLNGEFMTFRVWPYKTKQAKLPSNTFEMLYRGSTLRHLYLLTKSSLDLLSGQAIKTQPMCLSHASVSRRKCLFRRAKARIGLIPAFHVVSIMCCDPSTLGCRASFDRQFRASYWEVQLCGQNLGQPARRCCTR